MYSFYVMYLALVLGKGTFVDFSRIQAIYEYISGMYVLHPIISSCLFFANLLFLPEDRKCPLHRSNINVFVSRWTK